MKQITEAALAHLMAACPGATVEHRDGRRIVVIPTYDVTNDIISVVEKEVISGPDETPMGILPVFNIRKGATFNPDGEPKVSPLGHFYRIIGYSPPPNKDNTR